jgi:phytanoyl-CoA hydroxylase
MQVTNHNGLEVNDGPLLPENIAYLTPSSPSEPLETLRARYEQDGMLLLKSLLPREDVLRTRTKYFEMMSPSGVLQPTTQPVEGVFNSSRSPDDFPGIGAGATGQNGRPGGEGAQAFVDLAIKAHYQDWYTKDLAKHPALLDFIAKFTGWNENILGFNRSLLRNNVPGTKPIGVHYDQIFLRYGEPTSVTAWVPIGDVSLAGGGLIYLEDGTCPSPLWMTNTNRGAGDAVGAQIESEFTKKAREAGMTEEEARNAFNQNMMSTGLLSEYPLEFARQYNRRWLVSTYEAGDVVLHKPHAVCLYPPP